MLVCVVCVCVCACVCVCIIRATCVLFVTHDAWCIAIVCQRCYQSLPFKRQPFSYVNSIFLLCFAALAASTPGAELAAEIINEDQELLPGYSLNLTVLDSEVLLRAVG